MSTQIAPPIPRQPIGTTFVVAISVLGLVAIIQFFAVAWHIFPEVSKQAANPAATSAQATATNVQAAPDPAPLIQAPAPANPNAQKIDALIRQADQLSRTGQDDASLKLLDEADSLLPNDAAIIFRRGLALEHLDQPADAAEAYERVLSLPGLTKNTLQQARQRLSQLGEAANRTVNPAKRSSVAQSPEGQDMRDSVGLQPGATLGIVDTKIRDGEDKNKVLRIAIKSRPNSKIEIKDVELRVFFYDHTEEGDVTLTESRVVSQWISPPINWSDNEPEVLDVIYAGPPEDTGLKLHGYVVGVYYNKELQDSRADPGRLDQQFPLPLYLK